MLVIAIVIIILYLYTTKYSINILTAIVCIDRDADLAHQLCSALVKCGSGDIMIVTRDSDVKTINFWKNKAIVRTVPHYEIKNRHNCEKIAEERSMVVDYARKKYDAIWFVDSDVIPIPGTLKELSKTTKDVCVAPYRVKWSGYPCVGIKSDQPPYIKIHNITPNDQLIERRPCLIAGFGCTYIRKSTFNIKIESKNLGEGHGEDLGFFVNCMNAGLKCEYLTRWEQPHLYDRYNAL